MNKKSKLIEEIIKEARVDGEKYFDKLNDYTERYLGKLLKVIKKL